MPVTKSSEGEKYQVSEVIIYLNKITSVSLIYIDGTEIKVSWTQEVKKATTGDRSVALYDTEGFTALRKSRALGQVGQG